MRLPAAHLIHRYLGLSTAFFLLLIIASGIALNHAPALGLDKQQVRWPWLLRWYNVKPPAVSGHVLLGDDNTLSLLDNTLYLNQQALSGNTPNADALLGAGCTDMLCSALGSNPTGLHLVLFAASGELIEVLYDVPKNARQLGIVTRDDVSQFIISSRGAAQAGTTQATYWLADVDMTHWQQLENHSPFPANAQWTKTSALSPEAQQQLYRAADIQTISWERVLGDIHSGRILGAWGPWVVDIIGLLVMFLAMTGTWVWIKQARARRG